MVPYLRLMGLSEMAIEAWTKAEMETDTYKVRMLSMVAPRLASAFSATALTHCACFDNIYIYCYTSPLCVCAHSNWRVYCL